jgi:hypothetical protein
VEQSSDLYFVCNNLLIVPCFLQHLFIAGAVLKILLHNKVCGVCILIF